jgi:hypothetical protein
MNGKKIAVVALSVFILAGGMAVSLQAQKQAKTEPKVFIPKEVKTVLEAGLLTKQPRTDIPFAMTGHLYLPAGNSFHNVLSLEIANKDLGFAPAAAAPAAPAKEKPAEGQAPAEQPAEMRAAFSLFLQFREISGGLPGQVIKEVYVPCEERVPAAGYDPETKETYYVGYPLPGGKYLAALALTSVDLKKIGTQYCEFSTPDPASFTDRLETTPVFSADAIERLEAPETRTVLHRNYFTYSILRIAPNVNNVLAFKENFDIFYFVFGARPDAEQKYSLETNFEVKMGDVSAIKFAPAVMDSPLISLPLPMKKTIVTQADTGETKEEKDLEPGSYVLVIKITDKNSGNSVTKNVPFEVR